MEMWMSLFQQSDTSGNKPHFKILCKDSDGVEHEAAFWPAKDRAGNPKQGFSGKLKPKEKKVTQATEVALAKLYDADSEIPF